MFVFTLKPRQLTPLFSAFSLQPVADFAHIKCSPGSLTLTVSHSPSHSHLSSRFVAAIHLIDPFLNVSFSSGALPSRLSIIPLHRFLLPLLQMDLVHHNDLYINILFPERESYPQLSLATGAGDIRSLTPLMALPPYVGRINYKMFAAIDAELFRDIARQLFIYNATIGVHVSASQVTFRVIIQGILHREINLFTQRRQCVVGGIEATDGEMLSITLNPLKFFIDASFSTRFVWFFRSIDLCPIIQFLQGEWANILTYYPPPGLQSMVPQTGLC